MEITDVKAALIIQKWYKRFKSRQELRRLCYWKIFQTIEYDHEQNEILLQQFFKKVLDQLPDDNTTGILNAILNNCESGPNVDSALPTPDQFTLDLNYAGPKLELPITTQSIQTLIDAFLKGQLLHPRYLCLLSTEATQVLRRQSNVRDVSTEQAGKVTVVGSLRGGIEDLISILEKNNLPSAWNPYIFTGNYVDGGRHSLEVLALLLALVVVSPEAVTLLRGRHEDSNINLKNGLYEEVFQKYKSNRVSKMVFQLLEEVYRWLSLAAVVDEKVVVVSGGMSLETDFELIKTLDRSQFRSIIQAPPGISSSVDKEKIMEELQQVKDLIWCEPKRSRGFDKKNANCGGFFGPDVLEDVLKKNGFTKMIQCSSFCHFEGYKRFHQKKCVSLFSTSNHNRGSNFGVYLILNGKEHEEVIVQFKINKKNWERNRNLSFKSEFDLEEEAVLAELHNMIEAKRTVLMKAFNEKDNDTNGSISKSDWVNVMSTHCGQNIPWALLCSQITTKESDSEMVNYISTFGKNKKTAESGKEDSVVAALYPHRKNLSLIFRLLDRDNSGTLTKDELVKFCTMLGSHFEMNFEEDSIEAIVKTLDFNQDGKINFNEFLEAFRNL